MGVCPTPFAIVRYNPDTLEAIRDEKRFLRKVPVGTPGLMLNKITNLSPFTGYTSEKESHKKLIRDAFKKGDAWFNTGDLMREIGMKHVQFVDRLGDTFRWKGENVSTTEVEGIVNQMENVAGSTAYGVSIPGMDGRAGMVSIIPASMEDDLDKTRLAEVFRRDLPSYAVPLFIRIKTHFETTATFKIKKTDLKTEGFDPQKATDPLYVLLPGTSAYQPLTQAIYDDIVAGKYKF